MCMDYTVCTVCLWRCHHKSHCGLSRNQLFFFFFARNLFNVFKWLLQSKIYYLHGGSIGDAKPFGWHTKDQINVRVSGLDNEITMYVCYMATCFTIILTYLFVVFKDVAWRQSKMFLVLDYVLTGLEWVVNTPFFVICFCVNKKVNISVIFEPKFWLFKVYFCSWFWEGLMWP